MYVYAKMRHIERRRRHRGNGKFRFLPLCPSPPAESSSSSQCLPSVGSPGRRARWYLFHLGSWAEKDETERRRPPSQRGRTDADGRTRTIFVHKSENPFYLTEALQPCPTDCTVCTALRDHLLRPGQLTFPWCKHSFGFDLSWCQHSGRRRTAKGRTDGRTDGRRTLGTSISPMSPCITN